MEISNIGKNPQLPSPHFPLKQVDAVGLKESQQVVVGRGETEGEISQLASSVKGDSEIRNRLLTEIKAKIMAGQYQTRSAVEKAAQNLIEL